MKLAIVTLFATVACASVQAKVASAQAKVTPNTRRYRNEVWTREQERAHGIVRNGGKFKSSRPQDTIETGSLPQAYNWCDMNGTSYCTTSRNQHIPQYCGSCWAHGSVSALGDRLKIRRKAKGSDINLSVQHLLNCGGVGTCHGGSVVGPYQWLHDISTNTGSGISYETSNPYMACTSDSQEGFCPNVDWSCTPVNIAKTCSTFSDHGGKCVGLTHYPNVTIAEFGEISGADNMAKEIYARGPIACGIDAESMLLNYTGGIATTPGQGIDHVISVTGWGYDSQSGKQYWIVRNSWGEYWGELGYIRVEKGKNALNLEEDCAWATIADWTETNYPCYEGGDNCQ